MHFIGSTNRCIWKREVLWRIVQDTVAQEACEGRTVVRCSVGERLKPFTFTTETILCTDGWARVIYTKELLIT